MKVYLVRHGDSEGKRGANDREKLGIGLSSFGRLEARATAQKIASYGITRLFASPVERASETAQIIGEVCGIEVEYAETLREFSANLDERDASRQKEYKKQARDNPNLSMPGGESLNEAIGRLEKFLNTELPREGGAVCIVSHRVVIEGFLAQEFGVMESESEWLPSASITALEIVDEKKKLLFTGFRPMNLSLFFETVKRKVKFIFNI